MPEPDPFEAALGAMHLELAAFTRKWVSAMEAVVEEVQAATPAREIIAGMFEAMAKAVREGQSG